MTTWYDPLPSSSRVSQLSHPQRAFGNHDRSSVVLLSFLLLASHRFSLSISSPSFSTILIAVCLFPRLNFLAHKSPFAFSSRPLGWFVCLLFRLATSSSTCFPPSLCVPIRLGVYTSDCVFLQVDIDDTPLLVGPDVLSDVVFQALVSPSHSNYTSISLLSFVLSSV